MPGLTGSDVKSLREAYNNIYANQNNIEFTEDQLIEHFECWVDSLVENGYNLNDHTFDEIYETYLNENWNWRQLGTQARKQLDRAGRSIWKGVTTAASATSEFGKGLVTGKEKDEPPSTPPTAKTKPSSGVKVDLGLPSVQQFFNPKWWAPDRPAAAPSAAKTKYRVDASGRMVRSEETDIEEQTRVRARQTKGGKSVFGSVETKGGKPVPGSFKPATGSTADIKRAEVEYNIARNEAQRRLAQSDPNAYFGTNSSKPATTKLKSTTTQPATPAADSSKPPTPTVPLPRPPRPTAPPAPPVETRISSVTGKKEYVGTASGGQKFERRAATRAELEAAQKARKETLSAGKTKPEAEKAAVTAGIAASKTQKEEVMTREPYDLVLEYLLSQGHVDTLEEALYVMMQMSSEYIQNIVEQEGFRSDGRYQLPDGRTMGPIPGAFRALFTGNLPKSRTYVPPSTQTPTNRPPAVPASKDDSGKLTDFGAGGGKAKMKQGMSVGQVERQGRRNRGDYSG